VVLLVCLAWILIGVVLGSQTALGMSMQGTPIGLASALRTSLVNALPWIPATLVAIRMGARLPVTRSTWPRRLPVHLLAVPLVGWLANAGVVLGFWWMAGTFQGWSALARQVTMWATIRIHVAGVVYGVAYALTRGWLYVRDARTRELRVAQLEAQLTRARLQALNEQIRPHFLFNTLHAIGQMWRSGRADEADSMLDRLGLLFQRVRSSTDRPRIRLDEELSMVEDYLAIERARFSDRLNVSVSAAPEARACLVPPLLLQPLVENAVRHGVSTSPEACRVDVSATIRGAWLVLEVVDDGAGPGRGSSKAGTGTGLSNTRERLRHAYDGEHRFDIEERHGGGTRVTIEIRASLDPDEHGWRP
jgi:hypothetical protein